MKFLPLSQGKFAIIDDEDFKKVGQFKWYAFKKPSGNFYVVRHVGKRPNRNRVSLHCELLGIKGVDHINGDGLDCRRENMRPATPKQQQQGFKRKRAECSSKYRGVTWHGRGQKWQAQIHCNYQTFYLGHFKVEENAARAYDKKAIELGFFKEALNFP